MAYLPPFLFPLPSPPPFTLPVQWGRLHPWRWCSRKWARLQDENNVDRRAWDLVIFIFVLFQAFSIPLRIAFRALWEANGINGGLMVRPT